MTCMLELSDKYTKKAIIKILKWATKNVLETNENLEGLSKDTDYVKKNQMEVLELKNTITKLKNTVEGLKSKRKNSYNWSYSIWTTEIQ